MKTIALASLCSWLSFLPAFGADGWMTDFEAAKKKAAAENKDLLIDFTGSDWCPPCIKLKTDVLSQEAFSKGVAAHFVLVELDFPKDSSAMSEETIAQNEKLVEEYGVEGFPTLYLTDASGRPFALTGYKPGTPEEYVAHLGELRKLEGERDEALAAIAKVEGGARAEAIEKLLQIVPKESIPGFYKAELAELGTLKPEAEIVVELTAAAVRAEQDAQFNALFEAKDSEGVAALVDKIAKEKNLKGAELQEILAYKVNAYVMVDELLKAVHALDEVVMIDEKSRYGEGAQKYKMSLLVKMAEKKKAEMAAEGLEVPEAPVPPGTEVAPAKPAVEKPAAPKPEEKKDAPAKPAGKTPGRAVTEPVEKPARVVSPAVKLDPNQKKKEPAAEEGPGKKEARAGRKAAEKKGAGHAAKGLSGKSDEELRHGLKKTRDLHRQAVLKVNLTDKMLNKFAEEVKVQEEAVEKSADGAAEAKTELNEAKKKQEMVEKKHASAHKEEESIKKRIALHEEELKRRGEIAALEKEANELQKKAEQLRKKAEKLKN